MCGKSRGSSGTNSSGTNNNTHNTHNTHNTTVAFHHKIVDDNSCLFHAVAFLLHRSETPAQLRQLIATTVRNDAFTWNDAMLGKTQSQYIAYITDSLKWGGQVELNIMSSLFQVEIAAIDIQSGRIDTYGHGEQYSQRVYLLFSGIHFDAVVFDHSSGKRAVLPTDAKAKEAAQKLATSLQTQGKFTDQATMTLYCKVCGHVMKGDLEARTHAGASGHTEFAMKK
jgi:ubiquitin thioesterase OTU1